MLIALQGAVSQGVLWGIMVLGVFITFRLLDIPDMTCDGSFALGGCVCAVLIVNNNVDPLLAVLAGMCAGAIAGAVTGILTTVFEIPAILAGILTQISLWSINLRIMGKANLPLLQQDTIFTIWQFTGLDKSMTTLVIGAIIVLIVAVLNYWFFGTEIGAAVRATGNNPHMICANGINTDAMVVLGLLLSNGLVAMSGALVAQSNGFADVGMGVGTIVIGLASVIIGEVLFGTRSFKNCLISVILGSIVYRAVIAAVLQMGMPPNDLKLFTAILVAIALSLPLIQARFNALRKAVKK